MFSENAMKHANACRFCWMCRHLCPVGLQTGKEINTPRAKGLLLSLHERGAAFDADVAQAMYECTLCGACSNDCATNYEPPIFIREARTEAVVQNLVPAAVQTVIDDVLSEGNAFGLKAASKWDEIADEVKDLPAKADVLVYVGNTAAYKTPAMAAAVLRLLKKAGVSFTVLKDEPTAGTELGDLIGFVEEVRSQAKACADAINAVGAKTVVVVDPYDAVTMKHRYPEWGCAIDADVQTATAYMAALVAEGKLTPKALDKVATYHDSTPLARDLDEHQPARDLMAAMGVQLHEMFLNRRMAKCCGSEIFKQYAPELAKKTATGRWDDVRRAGMDTLIVACPEAYDVMGSVLPEGHQIFDLFTLLAEACEA